MQRFNSFRKRGPYRSAAPNLLHLLKFRIISANDLKGILMFSCFRLRNHCALFLRLVLTLTAAIVLLSGITSSAEDVPGASILHLQEPGENFVPAEYGEIVYQKNAHSPQQIFIIGQSHRSAITGQDCPDNAKVQAEIYRIGEWLIQKKNVEMLLPEGFFKRASPKDSSRKLAVRGASPLDSKSLEEKLTDTTRFVNADLLLNDSFNVRLGQIENEQLYWDIRRLMLEAKQNNNLQLLTELDKLQDERTAAMLQNIPGVVEEAFQEGSIVHRRAMFTIGLAHLKGIIHFLQNGSLQLPIVNSPQSDMEIIEASLKLLDQGYGVTVIIPKTLAQNKQVLRLAKLQSD